MQEYLIRIEVLLTVQAEDHEDASAKAWEILDDWQPAEGNDVDVRQVSVLEQ